MRQKQSNSEPTQTTVSETGKAVFIKYQYGRPVEFDTRYGRGPSGTLPLKTVADLIEAYQCRHGSPLANVFCGQIFLYLPDGVTQFSSGLADDCFEKPKDQDTALRIDCPLSSLGEFGTDFHQPLIIKCKGVNQVEFETHCLIEFLADYTGGFEAETVIPLPEDLCAIYGICTFPQGLYVRKDYIILRYLMEKWMITTNYKCRSIVTGTPGIGKSVFFIYWLLLSIKQKQNVFFRPLCGARVYITFTKEGYSVGSQRVGNSKYRALIDDKEYIEDFGPYSVMFLFAFPYEPHFNHFQKGNCNILTMNTWEKDELEVLANLHNISWSSIEPRYQAWGGVPRRIFSLLDTHNPPYMPNNIQELDRHFYDVFQLSLASENQHRLFHFYRKSNMKYCTSELELKFATEFVKHVICSRGVDLPYFYRNFISLGGSFSDTRQDLLASLLNLNLKMRSLSKPSVYTIDIGKIEACYFETIDQVVAENTLYTSSRFAVDGFIILSHLKLILYIKVGNGIDHTLLLEYYSVLNSTFYGFQHVLLFVVGADDFQRFSRRDIVEQGIKDPCIDFPLYVGVNTEPKF